MVFADDGTSDEASFFAEEINLPPDSTAARGEVQRLEPCTGNEALVVFHSVQVENVLSDQRMEIPEHPSYQQGDRALHNGLSAPTLGPAVQDAPPPADRLVGYPAQESDQDVQGTSELRLPRGYDDQPRFQLQTNDFQVNVISCLSENDQAIEQSCNMQELRLWKKEIARQVSNP